MVDRRVLHSHVRKKRRAAGRSSRSTSPKDNARSLASLPQTHPPIYPSHRLTGFPANSTRLMSRNELVHLATCVSWEVEVLLDEKARRENSSIGMV